MPSDLTRRQLLKAQAGALAGSAAGLPQEALAQPVAGGVEALRVKWAKAPCHLCGTGGGVMVGVKEGKVVAGRGDMQHEVNPGLACPMGYTPRRRSCTARIALSRRGCASRAGSTTRTANSSV